MPDYACLEGEFHLSDPRIVVRRLSREELPYPTPGALRPVVMEPTPGHSAELSLITATHSDALKRLLVRTGALLFRGFSIEVPQDLETGLQGLRWARPMSGYFMSEPGRVLDTRARQVFVTNSFFKTGGGFTRLGSGFHSENYYSVDVPQFQAFWCSRPPRLGGETALCFMAKAFAALGPATRLVLTQLPACPARAWTLRRVAARYGVPVELVGEVASDYGLRRVGAGGEQWLVLEKPSVVRHPDTGDLSLQVNLSRELPALTPLLGQRFAASYRRAGWLLHRAAWRSPSFLAVAESVETALGALSAPLAEWRALAGRYEARRDTVESSTRAPLSRAPRLEAQLAPDLVSELAAAIWEHCCVFTWRAGDVLLIDNFQMLHAGMPGLGPRELRVMLFNSTLVTPRATRGDSLHARLGADY